MQTQYGGKVSKVLYIENIYRSILRELTPEESKHAEFGVYQIDEFIKNKFDCMGDNLSLHLKIRENRKQKVVDILNKLSYGRIVWDNTYRMVYEIKKGKNYIICDYVVNSHITIPRSFLKHFGRKDSSRAKVVDYIDVNTKQIKSKKVKEYGAKYGYYSKPVEDFLSKNFESKMGSISKEIMCLINKEKSVMLITPEMELDIKNFFSITLCRNPKSLKVFNEESLSSKLLGEVSHNKMIELISKTKLLNVFEKLRFNIMINKTDRDFVINDTMISRTTVDTNNTILIMPINKRVCLALLEEDYFKEYMKNGEFHYMNVAYENTVDAINRKIYRFAKYYNENVIGSKNELELLLCKEENI